MFKVGQNATVSCKGMEFIVKVLEIKESYGRVRYRVKPIQGSGEGMVEKLNVKR